MLKLQWTSTASAQAWTDQISADELARADLQRDERDRFARIAAYALLRRMLAAELGLTAREIRLTRDAVDRPVLAEGPAKLRFSITHTRGLAAVLLGECRKLGIDAEPFSAGAIAITAQSEIFNPAERVRLAALRGTPAEQEAVRIWCLKEAYLKALGIGIATDCRTLGVPEGLDTVIAAGGQSDQTDWQFGTQMVDQSFTLAWAVEP